MTMSLNIFMRNSVCNNFGLLQSLSKIHCTQVKNLYSPAALGVDTFLQQRKKTIERFSGYADKFQTKMEAFVHDKDNMIFTEDLKNAIHLGEPTDVDLIVKMIKKYNLNSELRFGSFVFGPVVMRMFHFFDAPNEALECFLDPANKNFFDQQTSFQILLDLLYNNQMYDEMFKAYELIKEKQVNMTKFPKYSIVLILAASYKQNTPESLEYATKLWTEMTKVGTIPLRRACSYFAALALNQGAPHAALEAISTQRPHYVTLRNIKAVALAEIGRLEDAFLVFKFVLDTDSPTAHFKHTFTEETINKVQAVIEKTNNDDYKKEFEKICNALEDRSLIELKTLDQYLNEEIKPLPRNQDNTNTYGDRQMKFAHRNKRIL